MHQRVRQALAQRQRAPSVFGAVVARRAAHAVGDVEQALGGVGAAIEHHVFDARAQLGLELVIDADHAGVDDAHVHAGLDGVVQKHGVDGLAHRVVAAKAKAHVAHAARHLGPGQVGLDPARGLDEIDGVVVVLGNAGGDGEDVGVKDDVFGRKAHLIDQDAVGAGADLGLARKGVGLPLLVEGHDHGGGAVAPDQARLAFELGLALFEADRVHQPLALHALEPGLDHAPFGGVDHHRHACDVGLAGHEVQKAHHRRLAVEHRFVHVDVDDLGAVFHLLARHRQRLLVVAVEDQARKGLGAGDVGALADVDEQRVGVDAQQLQAREQHRAGLGAVGGAAWGGWAGGGGRVCVHKKGAGWVQ